MLKLIRLKIIIFGMACGLTFNLQAEVTGVSSSDSSISESPKEESPPHLATSLDEPKLVPKLEKTIEEMPERPQEEKIAQTPKKDESKVSLSAEPKSLEVKPPSEVVEKQASEAKDQTVKKESEPKKQVQAQVESDVSPSLSPLFKAESMRVCSMGHRNHKVEKFEYIKKQEINGSKKRVKYSARQNPRFECQIALENKERDLVYLSCWKGTFDKVNLSRFQLSYFYKSDYLFVNKKNGKMVLLKVDAPEGSCSSDFRPVVKKKVQVLKIQETGPGLADLTF